MSTETKLTIRDILSTPWNELDKQQVFDQITEHLLTQSCKAEYLEIVGCEPKPRCAYRGTNGTKCAVGILIPDCEYSGQMETKAVGSLLQDFYSSFEPIDSRITHFLRFFQGVHDSNHPSAWKSKLFDIVQYYPEINTDILTTFNWNYQEKKYERHQ